MLIYLFSSKQNIIDEEIKQKDTLVKKIALLRKEISDFNNIANQTQMRFSQDYAKIKELQDKKQDMEDKIKINEMMLVEANNSVENERSQKIILEKQRGEMLREAGV